VYDVALIFFDAAIGENCSARNDVMAVNGRLDEFAAALLAHLPRLRRYAIALSHDANLADDLVQECVEKALRNREALNQQSHVSGWLRSILHNLYLDTLRRERRRGISVDWQDSANMVELSVAPTDGSAARELQEAMSELSIEHRQILLLVGLEGRSYRDVASELNIPIGTVMSRLARARAQLRLALEYADGTRERPAAHNPQGKAKVR
jgi:RNA polymerase sigma-70 factor (ECF subfamily)